MKSVLIFSLVTLCAFASHAKQCETVDVKVELAAISAEGVSSGDIVLAARKLEGIKKIDINNCIAQRRTFNQADAAFATAYYRASADSEIKNLLKTITLLKEAATDPSIPELKRVLIPGAIKRAENELREKQIFYNDTLKYIENATR